MQQYIQRNELVNLNKIFSDEEEDVQELGTIADEILRIEELLNYKEEPIIPETTPEIIAQTDTEQTTPPLKLKLQRTKDQPSEFWYVDSEHTKDQESNLRTNESGPKSTKITLKRTPQSDSWKMTTDNYNPPTPHRKSQKNRKSQTPKNNTSKKK